MASPIEQSQETACTATSSPRFVTYAHDGDMTDGPFSIFKSASQLAGTRSTWEQKVSETSVTSGRKEVSLGFATLSYDSPNPPFISNRSHVRRIVLDGDKHPHHGMGRTVQLSAQAVNSQIYGNHRDN